VTDWTKLRSGSTGRSSKLHAVDPDMRVTELGVSSLCGKWLVELSDETVVWDREHANVCLICREKQRQFLTTRRW
jgi:hypothetical protein